MLNKIKTEPVAFFGALRAVLISLFVTLLAFNVWSPSDEQVGAIGGVYVALSGFITYLVRQSVTPVPGPLT